MTKFRHDIKHLSSQQQEIIRKRDEKNRMTKESYEKEKKQSKEIYKEYKISVSKTKGSYEVIGLKGENRESSYGDSKEDAIDKLKQKIDAIDAYKETYKEK